MGKAKKDCSWGYGGSFKPPNFFFVFCIKHAKTVTDRVNIGPKISVVTVINVIITFSTII